jgi:DNA replication and repair protein RecF
LKKFAEDNYYDPSSIEMWDDQIIRLGGRIHNIRQDFIRAFTPLFKQYFNFIASSREEVSIQYDSQMNERSLTELLAVSIDHDRAVRYTTAGIHKDDLIFTINGYPVKRYGSQGQQKSYVVAIKLAQFEYTRNIKEFKPILLLDDIFDKLDSGRVKQIIELVNENNFGQVFITDTQKERIEKIFLEVNTERKIFHIDEGDFTELMN